MMTMTPDIENSKN